MRLACLSHAASVQAEPGSNSSIEISRHEPILQPGVTPGLTVSRLVFVLETSLSIPPTGKTTCQRGLLPPDRLRSEGQSRPAHVTSDAAKRDARLNHLLASIVAYDGTLLELIKEDHLRAPRRCLSRPTRPKAGIGGSFICSNHAVHNTFELTSSRLSDYSLVKEQLVISG